MTGLVWCKRCILPQTRPGLSFDAEGVCSGCRGHMRKRTDIDWTLRRRELDAICARAKARSTGYDCIIPASGGKDSWVQVKFAQDLGLKALAVTWTTPARTALGQRNLTRMVEALSVDHIDYRIAPDVERRFLIAAMEDAGSAGLPMHMAIFAIPSFG